MIALDLAGSLRKKLEAESSPLPGRDGFHSGMRTNASAIELEYGQMIYGCVRHNKPQAIVELGTGLGYSTAWLLLGAGENGVGQIFTVDPTPRAPTVWESLAFPSSRVSVINGLSTSPSTLIQLPDVIDLLFYDVSTAWGDVERDLKIYLPRIKLGGVVLLHGVNVGRVMGDAVQEYFDQRSTEWKYEEISSASGVGIITRIFGAPESTNAVTHTRGQTNGRGNDKRRQPDKRR